MTAKTLKESLFTCDEKQCHNEAIVDFGVGLPHGWTFQGEAHRCDSCNDDLANDRLKDELTDLLTRYGHPSVVVFNGLIEISVDRAGA